MRVRSASTGISTGIRLPSVALGKDLLTLRGMRPQDLASLLRLAADLKQLQRKGILYQPLQGRTLGLIFEKPSTRTRVSFEAGIGQLGGRSLFLSAGDIQLSRGESIADTAHVLSRYLDGLVIRTYDHWIVEEWAKHATIPVINGLTDWCHPCQALSDLQTIQERLGRLKGSKLAYVGDGNNVTNSLIEAAAKVGMSISVGCPTGYEPDQRVLDLSREEAARTGSTIEVTANANVAVKDADIIYTDVWVSMGREREKARRLKALAPYQVNERLLKLAKPTVFVMHCLPAHRGEEITAAVLDGLQSIVLDQAENRLHMQKAILVTLLNRSRTGAKATGRKG